MIKKVEFWQGIRDGIPIGLGYFAVAFSLGIIAKNAGLNPIHGFVASLLNLASAGEYALFNSIAAKASYFEIAIATLIINARYFLMSCSLSQRFDEKTPFIHRFFVGYGITDEIFGISIARPDKLNPFYSYGAILIAAPLWALGTSFGIVAGTYLPVRIVSALSVALYGMFIAIIIPPCKKNIIIASAVFSGFILSFLFSRWSFTKEISSGTRTIILTVVLSSICAFVKPIEDKDSQNGENTDEL